MRHRLRNVITLCGISALAPVGLAQDMLAVDWLGQAYALDSGTGIASAVGSSTVPGNPNAMTQGPQGQIFLTYRTTVSSSDSQFAAIDRTTGTVTPFGAALPIDTRGLAYGPNGLFYGIADGVSGVIDGLYTYDLQTQAFTMIGLTGLKAIQALEFAPNGTLYGWDVANTGKGLITIDPATGAATDVNPGVGDVPTDSVQFLAFAPDGSLFAGRHSLHSVDPATGIPTQIMTGLSDLRGAAFTEASCGLSFGSGCAGTGGFVPALEAASCPDPGIGGTLALRLADGLGGAVSMFVLGLNQTALPLGGGCTFHVQPALVSFLVPSGGAGPGNGFVLLAATVPAAAAGLTFTAQGFFADPAAAPGFAASNGLQVTIP